MEEEEYEFDILWDNKKGLWVTTLRNGRYLINAKIKGFTELNKYIEIGEREFKFLCVPANKDIPVLKVQAVNVENGKPIKNVFYELWKENTQ